MGSHTNPIQHVEFGVNTNSSNPNFSTQTEPIDLSNQTTNTPYFIEMTSQTIPKSTRTISTPSPRQTSTQTEPLSFSTKTTSTQPAKEDDCHC